MRKGERIELADAMRNHGSATAIQARWALAYEYSGQGVEWAKCSPLCCFHLVGIKWTLSQTPERQQLSRVT